jgi:hypothetical protein
MASVVNIELRVDEAGAVTGIRAFDGVLQKATGSVRQLDAAGKQASATLSQVGQQAQVAGQETAAGANQAAAGMDKLRSKSALARFELQEMGLRAPRYFASAIASSKALLGVMQSLSGVFLGFAAISMGTMAIEGIHHLYDSWLNVDKAQQEYTSQLAQQRDEDFPHVQSIETAIERLHEATKAAEEYNDEANRQLSGESVDVANLMAAKAAREGEVGKRKQTDAITPELASMEHNLNLQKIETSHAGDARLKGEQKITAELQKQLDINKENQGYTGVQETLHGNAAAPNAGQQERDLKDQAARSSADAERANLGEAAQQKARERTGEMTRLQNEASNASVRGDRLAAQQREQAYADFVRKYGADTAARAAIDAKYFANLKREEEDAQRATNKLVESSHAAGLTGFARSDAEYQAKYNDMVEEAIASGKISEIHQIAQRGGVMSSEHDRENEGQEDAYYQHLNELVDGWNSHQEQGFARIAIETKNHIVELQAEYKKLYGQLPPNDPRRTQGTAALNSSIDKTNAEAGQQGTELAEKNLNETLKLEDEARRRSLPIEQQKTQELYDQYRERVRGYEQSLKDKLISDEDYNRRVAAAGRDLSAELATQAKEQRDKLAGQLDGLFKSPQKWLKETGTHMMAQSGAAILQRLQPHLPHQLARGGAPDENAGSGGGFFGGIFGGWTGKGKHGVAGMPGVLPGVGTPEHAAMSTLSISTATISVQSATISGMGGGQPSTSTGESLPVSTAAGSRAPGAGAIGSGVDDFNASVGGVGGLSAGSSAASSHAAGASAPDKGASGVLGDITGTMGLFNQAKSTFGKASSTASDASYYSPTAASVEGDYSSSDSTKLPSSSVDGMGALQGGMGLYGAAMSTGGFGGALGGAMSGMQLGMSVAGPWGAAAGAVGGAVIGLLGFGGRAQAASYWAKQGRPHMDQTDQAFATGAMPYMDAYNDMNSLEVEARNATNKMGWGGSRYFGDTIKPTLEREKRKFTQEERAGRGNFTVSTAQYHTGGLVDDFYGLATSSDEGFIHARRGEIVVQPQAARQHAPLIHAMNAGASSEQVAKSYQSTMQSATARQSGGGDRTVNMNFASLDSKSTARLFMENKHHVRAALNASYGEYSGGADASN